jgi:hypothetical protein
MAGSPVYFVQILSKPPNFIIMLRTHTVCYLMAVVIALSSCSSTIMPAKPELSSFRYQADTLPLSEIDIPLHISLKSIYEIAEAQVDTVYTSPGWPDQYIIDNCSSRYMYHFRRGPLRMEASGNILNLGFTGYYKIKGATRVCVGGKPITLWSPTCTCGFNEPERRVEVGFRATLGINRNYSVQSFIERQEPRPIDKCEMCFWGQDITPLVMDGLKLQLDSSRIYLEDTLASLNLRPYFQQIWDRINAIHPLYGLGYLNLQPERIRLSQLNAYNDTLHLSFGISARPQITMQRPLHRPAAVPDLSEEEPGRGFALYIDNRLNYDSLSRIVSAEFKGRRIDLDNAGPIKKHIIIESFTIYGARGDKLVIQLSFSGSDKGTIYLTGKPVYDRARKLLEIRDLEYDIRTRDLLVKSAQWLFSRKILNELRKYSQFDMQPYFTTLMTTINTQLKRELVNGVSMEGALSNFDLIDIHPLAEELVIRCECRGNLEVYIGTLSF